MSQRYYYLRSGDYGMDQFGRWTDNPAAWKIYTHHFEVFNLLQTYPGSRVGML